MLGKKNLKNCLHVGTHSSRRVPLSLSPTVSMVFNESIGMMQNLQDNQKKWPCTLLSTLCSVADKHISIYTKRERCCSAALGCNQQLCKILTLAETQTSIVMLSLTFSKSTALADEQFA